jgi:hypothetical protein
MRLIHHRHHDWPPFHDTTSNHRRERGKNTGGMTAVTQLADPIPRYADAQTSVQWFRPLTP